VTRKSELVTRDQGIHLLEDLRSPMPSHLVKFLFCFHITETLILIKMMMLNRSMSATGKRNDHSMGFCTLKF